jgi:hypothetical protein
MSFPPKQHDVMVVSAKQEGVILSAAASLDSPRTGAGRRPKDLSSALGAQHPKRFPRRYSPAIRGDS